MEWEQPLKNDLIDLRHGDCQEIIKTLPDASLDVICIDPPYLYLKGQVLERPFDEFLFFSECFRVLKKGGFIVCFGRGTSFYRWNYLMSEMGFEFKEEIIWDKSQCSSPLMALSRVHETASIHVKVKGKINKVKVPYTHMKGNDLYSIRNDLKKLITAYKNPNCLKSIQKYLESGDIEYEVSEVFNGQNVTIQGSKGRMNRYVAVMKAMHEGMNEMSVIKEKRNHYNSIHPTEKPVGLLKRLLALVLPDYDKEIDYDKRPLVADFFSGSGSTGEACIEMGVRCLLTEIHQPFFIDSKSRLEKVYRNRDTQQNLF